MATSHWISWRSGGRTPLDGAPGCGSATDTVREERVDRSLQDMPGSAVMPSAKAILQPDWLLDELELRMTRCVPAASPALRIGTLLPAGESLHRIAATETRSWWLEMGLFDSDEQTHRIILDAMLKRNPTYLAWATVPLVSGYMDNLADLSVLERVVQWVTTSDDVDRVVRDAVALSVVVPWLKREDPRRSCDTILAWARSEAPAMIRMGLVAAAAYVREAKAVDQSLQRAMMDACWTHASRVDTETAIAVGWTLRELLNRDPERVMPVLLSRVHELSRQAMRTAVEGLAWETRLRVSSKWRERIHARLQPVATVGPNSAARTRRSV